MPVTSFSRTPADNNSSPPNGWPEGMAPSAVNNTARQLMTDIVNESGKGQAKVLASVAGTNTITASMTPDLDAYTAGMTVVFNPANTNTGATTINIDSLGALDVFRYGSEALQAGDLVSGTPAYLILDSGADDFYLLNPQNVGFRNVPPNSQTGNYTLVLSDSGKSVIKTGASTATWTIPPNSSVAFPTGTVVTLVNFGSANSISVARGAGVALFLAGDTAYTDANRSIALSGFATLYKASSDSWVIAGTGVS